MEGDFIQGLGEHEASHGCLEFRPNPGLKPSDQYYVEVEDHAVFTPFSHCFCRHLTPF